MKIDIYGKTLVLNYEVGDKPMCLEATIDELLDGTVADTFKKEVRYKYIIDIVSTAYNISRMKFMRDFRDKVTIHAIHGSLNREYVIASDGIQRQFGYKDVVDSLHTIMTKMVESSYDGKIIVNTLELQSKRLFSLYSTTSITFVTDHLPSDSISMDASAFFMDVFIHNLNERGYLSFMFEYDEAIFVVTREELESNAVLKIENPGFNTGSLIGRQGANVNRVIDKIKHEVPTSIVRRIQIVDVRGDENE